MGVVGLYFEVEVIRSSDNAWCSVFFLFHAELQANGVNVCLGDPNVFYLRNEIARNVIHVSMHYAISKAWILVASREFIG